MQLVLEVLEDRVKKGSSVYEKGHFLVLGWVNNRRDEEVMFKILSQVWRPLVPATARCRPSCPAGPPSSGSLAHLLPAAHLDAHLIALVPQHVNNVAGCLKCLLTCRLYDQLLADRQLRHISRLHQLQLDVKYVCTATCERIA